LFSFKTVRFGQFSTTLRINIKENATTFFNRILLSVLKPKIIMDIRLL